MSNVEDLAAENASLKQTIGTLNTCIAELEKLNSWYEEQFKLMKKKQFGTSSEQAKYNGVEEQCCLFNDVEAEHKAFQSEPTEETIVVEHKRKKGKRGESYEDLPVIQIEYTLPEKDQLCPQCGEPLHVMKKEIRKEIRVIPARLEIVEHITNYYTCRNCEKTGITTPVIAAPSPVALIPRSLVSPSMMAYLMNQKYSCGLPLYRMEQDLLRMGVNLSRQNMSNWIIAGASLLRPLAEKLKRELLSNDVLMADETPVQVLNEPGKTPQSKSYMWVYRTGVYAEHPVVQFDYRVGRSGEFAKDYLKGFNGKLTVDGYSGYEKLESVTLCGCWAHCKRYFDDALVPIPAKDRTPELPEAKGLAYCEKLFAIEKAATKAKLSAEARLKLRKTESKPVIEEFYQWVDIQENRTLPQSLLGKALTYAQNQKAKLLGFLDDGRVELSNNASERSVKSFVIGRKAWLFCDTQAGASASAMVYGIIQTAIENRLKPYAYLNYVFETIQRDGSDSTEKLLPWSEHIPEACRMSAKEIERYEKKKH